MEFADLDDLIDGCARQFTLMSSDLPREIGRADLMLAGRTRCGLAGGASHADFGVGGTSSNGEACKNTAPVSSIGQRATSFVPRLGVMGYADDRFSD